MSLRPVLRLHDCCRVRKELSLRMDDDSKANQTSSKHGFSILLQWRYYIYNFPRRRCSVSVLSYGSAGLRCFTGYYSVFISFRSMCGSIPQRATSVRIVSISHNYSFSAPIVRCTAQYWPRRCWGIESPRSTIAQ